MAFKTVAQYKESVSGMLSGINIENISDLDGALERAARRLVQNADIPEASGIQNITLYAGVTDYLIDERVYGTAINDIRPQGISRNPWDTVSKLDQQDFDRTKGLYPSGTISTFQFNNGTPIIRVVAPFPKQQIVISQMNAIGTTPNAWIAAGTASGLAVDQTVFYQSPASLRFTLTGSGSGTLTQTLQNPLSMANYQGVGVAFLAIRIPPNATASDLTNMSIRIGSDSANYNAVNATQGFLGAWVSGEWLLVSYDFSVASTVGSPNWSAIDYVQITFNHLSTMTNFHVGGLFMALPSPAQILYQSAAIFLPVGSNTTSAEISAPTDRIILSLPAYNLYVYEGALAALQNTGASESSATVATLNQVLNGVRARNGAVIQDGLYDLYRGDNPSQEIRLTGSWYDGGSSTNNYGTNGSDGW